MKLVVAEPESESLRSWIAERPEQVSSVVAAIEVRRAVLRLPAEAGAETSGAQGPTGGEPEVQATAGEAEVQARATRRRADVLLGGLGLIALDDKVVAAAGGVRPASVRTLDAIHVATALTIPGLEALVTYDDRLGEAARAAGINVIHPGR